MSAPDLTETEGLTVDEAAATLRIGRNADPRSMRSPNGPGQIGGVLVPSARWRPASDRVSARLAVLLTASGTDLRDEVPYGSVHAGGAL